MDSLHPIDLARAYWDPDRKNFGVWFPIWEKEGDPIGGPDRAWTVGPPGDDSQWHRNKPAIRVDPSWQASLIALADRTSYWLTSHGEWLRADFDPLESVEERLADTSAILLET